MSPGHPNREDFLSIVPYAIAYAEKSESEAAKKGPFCTSTLMGILATLGLSTQNLRLGPK